ncbi:hypothetical protein QQX98_010917 [Neonectria punicea]|uniref:Uncharacterized protein n=1 Tax=Neonectria punicea TaxID=979145 RepID=A0ABR1GNK7_9HYPO
MAQTATIDPMAKLDSSLSNMTADRLFTATTVDGESVFDNKDKNDLDNAVAALKEINQAKAELKRPGGAAAIQTTSTLAETAMVVQTRTSSITATAASGGSLFGDIKTAFWDVWHYVTSAWNKIKSWAIETYSELSKSIDRYAKYDCTNNTTSGGKDNIIDLVDATLDYGASNLDWASGRVDAKFDGWKATIKSHLAPEMVPDRVLMKPAGPKAQENVDGVSRDKMKQADVKQNWTKYQLTHGGALRGCSIEETAGTAVVQRYQDTWDTVIKPVFDSLSNSVSDIMHDLSLLFLFKELVNRKIKMPIFGDLWVLANRIFNRDVEAPTFTVIGFVGFVLAIPLTLTCKLFTGGHKPPAPPKFNVKTLSAFFDDSAAVSDKTSSSNGFAAMLETSAASMLAVVGLASTVGRGGALASIFDFQLLFGLIRVVVCFPARRDLPLWEVRCAVSAADAVNVFVLAIAHKADKGGKGEKLRAVLEGAVAMLNIGLNIAINTAELVDDWTDKDEERTGYQILIAVLGGVSTVGKSVATVSDEPWSKLAGVVTKQVAGKAAGFFNVVNTYSNIGKGRYIVILNPGS